MTGLPYSAAPNQLQRSGVSDTSIAVAFFVVLAVLTLTVAGAASMFSPPGCTLDDRLVLLHETGEGRAVSRRGAPCLIKPLRSDWRVKALEIVSPPANGKVAMRGATGLNYLPNAQFKGFDSFAFRVVRRTKTGDVWNEVITMKVEVD
ncbi:MAG: Ig-like domain-containing protein [Pseudorhodoplanes sp.]